ncbi:metallophosphoesterase [Paenibacillus sp. GSMTC-2017]|uniref:metallophosphoesterase n=1 Tax=Paenibacillus sp. GSMTC-2017 TaxID=2794350 RepID=UPI0018D8111E|nr:metallophosphoesterase [Paenibacillus sp. GSMTC-2017]MBH5317280.1 metallophosphoesterase [Paenibacillus sp. GSMTC-2017]
MIEWYVILLIVVICSILWYFLFIFPTQWLKVETVHYPLGIGARVLQISDLHVDMLRISSHRLAKTIDTIKPDYIFLTGDYTYKSSYLPKLERYLKAIASCGIPTYAVLGNHDHQVHSLQRLIRLFNIYNISVLRNSSLVFPTFELVGIDDYCTGHSRVQKAFRNVTGSKPVIVITHDPEVVLSINKQYNYLLAGHLHGKQMNVPLFFSIYPKGQLAASGIYKGLHVQPNNAFYISKGIGQAGVNARFMVRSEVTVHEL